MKERLSAEATGEWRSHWLLAVTSAFGASLSMIGLGSLGVFMQSLEQAFGWERAQISAGITLYAVTGVVCAPLLGRLIDRWGSRRFGVPGVALCGLTFSFFGAATGSAIQWLALWFLFALATQATRPLVWTAGISSCFDSGRGIAIAVVLTGTSFGSIAAPAIASQLIQAFSWRVAFVIMGLSWGGLAALICYFFYRPKDGSEARSVRAGGTASARPGMMASEALKSSRFARLGAAAFIINLLLISMSIHIVPLLSATGLTHGEASWLLSLLGVGAFAGKFICGFLVNRIPGNILGASVAALPIVPCLLFLEPSDSVSARAFPVLLQGIASGALTHLFAYLTTRYFGLRAFGTIYGSVGSLVAIAVGIGPLITGRVYDLMQSYDAALIAGVALSSAAAVLIFSLGRYPEEGPHHRARADGKTDAMEETPDAMQAT